MPSILPNAKAQFIDASGLPLVNGTVGFYSPGTLNPLPTYQDQACTIANTNPIALDSRGQALIWGSGVFRQIVKDYNGVTIWDQIVTSSDAAFTGNAGASLIGFDSTNLSVILTTRLNRVVDSISALRSLSKTTYTRAFATGYYLPHDGGGGAYQYDPADTTSTDNNGTIIVAADGGRWKLQYSGAVSIKQFGAKGDWNGTTGTDDTVAVQSAVTWQGTTGVKLHVPSVAGAYQLTSPITSAAYVNMGGEGCEMFLGVGGTNVNTRGPGSWFYINHTGKGFSINSGGSGLVTCTFEKIGTIRNQPTPNGAASFTPIANDYDFYIYNCESFFRDLFTLNPTNAIQITASASSSQSRTTIDNWRGQPLSVGLNVAFSADVVRTTNVHLWPYWSFAQGVTNYMLATAIGYYSGRNDNPMVSNWFSFGYGFGFQIYNTTNGSTHKMMLSNVDCDYSGVAGLYVGASVSVFMAYLNGFVVQGANQSTSGGGIIFDDGSSGNEILCSNVDIGLFSSSGIYIGGTSGNNVVRFSNSRIYQWNGANSNAPAINVRPGNFLYYDSATCEFVAPFNSGLVLSSTGTVVAGPSSWASTTLTTDAGGNVTIPNTTGHAFSGGVAVVNNSAAALTIQYVSSTATSTIFKVFTASTGAPLASSAISFNYILFF